MSQHYHLHQLREPDWEKGIHFEWRSCWDTACKDGVKAVKIGKANS